MVNNSFWTAETSPLEAAAAWRAAPTLPHTSSKVEGKENIQHTCCCSSMLVKCEKAEEEQLRACAPQLTCFAHASTSGALE